MLFVNSYLLLFVAGVLSALYKDINVVHPSLLSCVEPLESQQVRELLKRLGVHELEPQELLEQHIYPSVRSNQWKVQHHVFWTAIILILNSRCDARKKVS